jgi:hypothetical protein
MTEEVSQIPLGLCQCGCGAKTKISTSNDARHGYIKGQHRKYISGHEVVDMGIVKDGL